MPVYGKRNKRRNPVDTIGQTDILALGEI